MAHGMFEVRCHGCGLKTNTGAQKMPSRNSHRMIQIKCSGCGSSLVVKFRWGTKGQVNVEVTIKESSKLLQDIRAEEAASTAEAPAP